MINITVTSKKAVLSTIVNGKEHTKTVRSINVDSKTYEVISILRHLNEALHSLKKEDRVIVHILGTDTLQNVVNSTQYLKSQSYKQFNKKDGSAIFMKNEWVSIFSYDSLPLNLLRKNMIEFTYEYHYECDPNFSGD